MKDFFRNRANFYTNMSICNKNTIDLLKPRRKCVSTRITRLLHTRTHVKTVLARQTQIKNWLIWGIAGPRQKQDRHRPASQKI